MVEIAQPAFTGTGEDEIYELDAYAPVDTEVKNELKSKALDFKDNIKGNLDKALGNTKAFKDALGNINNTLNNNLKLANAARDTKARIELAIKGDRAALNSLLPGIQNRLNLNLNGLDQTGKLVSTINSNIDRVMYHVDGVKSFIDGDPHRIGAVLGLLDEVSNSKLNEFLDLGTYTAFASEMIYEIQTWPAIDLLDDIYRATKNESDEYEYQIDDYYRFEIGKNVSENLGSDVDLDFIDRIIEHSGPESLIAHNPDFPSQLLENYKIPLGTTTDESNERSYALELIKLTNVLDKLKPDWLWTYRGTTKVYNLEFISNASKDALKILRTNETLVDLLLAAEHFKVMSFKDLTLKLYPRIPSELI